MRILSFSVLALAFGALTVLTAPAFAQDAHVTSIIAAPHEYPTKPLNVITASGQVTFTVEVPRNETEMEKGLMFRKTLGPYAGMIFTFEPPQHVDMWMKNTLIPLDMLFINENGTIIQIAANTTPESTSLISSVKDTHYVVELAGGVAAHEGIAVGDHVQYPGIR